MTFTDIFWQDKNLRFTQDELAAFIKNFSIVEAAGGIVQTDFADGSRRFLYIYRNGKWDLPKGRREEGETEKENALREVEEETGLKGLEIIRSLGCTYHFMMGRDNIFRLKRTAWFHMKTASPQTPVPQTEEGIEKAEWLTMNELKLNLPLMYASIANLSSRFAIDLCEA